LRAVPTAAGAEAAAAARALLEAPALREIAAPAPAAVPADFHPYHSIPRSWRERGADLRLEGILPPGAPVPGRSNPTGTVVTWTADRVYPAAPVTGMAIVDVDGGGRFFGQVCAGEEVEIGSRIRLVPRRLHSGGDVVQYFWKVSPCR
ncbi:MAG: hypothetical protein JWQ18_1489, partial [Conexibacter sp.]|nr:hypothetical protein [Conexibacter sp.]